MPKTPLIERMQKRHAAKSWIKEVEAKDREIFDLEQIKTQYLSVINLLACEKEELEAETDVLRNTISLLKNKNERTAKLAHEYITAYEKLAFGEDDE